MRPPFRPLPPYSSPIRVLLPLDHRWASSDERIRHRLDFLSQMGVGRSGELRCTCLATADLGRKRRSNADARKSIKEAKARKAAAGTSASAASPSGAPMEP